MTIMLDTIHSVKWVIIERRDFGLQASGALETETLSRACGCQDNASLPIGERKAYLRPFLKL
jgi:hypothetical protein